MKRDYEYRVGVDFSEAYRLVGEDPALDPPSLNISGHVSVDLDDARGFHRATVDALRHTADVIEQTWLSRGAA